MALRPHEKGILLAVATVLLWAFTPPLHGLLNLPLSVVATSFVPGYLLVRCIWADSSNPVRAGMERIALAVVLSIAMVSVLGTILFFSDALSPGTLQITVTAFSLLFALGALDRDRRGRLPSAPAQRPRRRLAVALPWLAFSIASLVAAGSLLYAVHSGEEPASLECFLARTDGQSLTTPHHTVMNMPLGVRLHLQSHAGEGRAYDVALAYFNKTGALLESTSIALDVPPRQASVQEIPLGAQEEGEGWLRVMVTDATAKTACGLRLQIMAGPDAR